MTLSFSRTCARNARGLSATAELLVNTKVHMAVHRDQSGQGPCWSCAPASYMMQIRVLLAIANFFCYFLFILRMYVCYVYLIKITTECKQHYIYIFIHHQDGSTVEIRRLNKI